MTSARRVSLRRVHSVDLQQDVVESRKTHEYHPRMRTYDRLAGLDVAIERVTFEDIQEVVSAGFIRRSTIIRFSGDGLDGVGEDVIYEPEDHGVLQHFGLRLPPPGRYTIDSYSNALEERWLFAFNPARPVSANYRRWAIESAVLDLALRQAGIGLEAALGRAAKPLRFVCSLGLGQPVDLTRITKRLAIDPGLRFKLDPAPNWTPRVIVALADLGVVDTLDFKGQYEANLQISPPHPAMYAQLLGAFPDAWIEDPRLTPEVDSVLLPHRARVTWDAPIHGITDIEALPFAPTMVNVKPSRIGPLSALLDCYDWLEARGILAYSGGQFELGVGRGQVQALAAIFHPDAPNDIAPRPWNLADPPANVAHTPLEPRLLPVGFGWQE